MEIAVQVIMGVFLTCFMLATILDIFYTITEGDLDEPRSKDKRHSVGKRRVS